MYHDTDSFKDRLVSFNKSKHKTEYRSHLKDIKKSLEKFDSFEAVYNSHNFIQEFEGGERLIKHEIVDSHNKRGCNNGYRLMILCIPNKDEAGVNVKPMSGKVYLLDIYPKRGTLGAGNLTENRLEELVVGCVKNISTGKCSQFTL
ncbi:MAG TPA: hypothetical protein VFG10_20080 [Saprospiraceae bacterium]|nr:hypothetical protein [Saprospiraceae bacterium]